jgi:2-polyprenyl-3-methyl-5-hydroxy-6-metoxy-1,4-benzoquinol methylase
MIAFEPPSDLASSPTIGAVSGATGRKTLISGGPGSGVWDPYVFGGSAKQVRRTQRRFVRVFAGHAPVLDIGCGRGIFLQLLRDSGIEGIGIDRYEPAVAACCSQGLTAHVADALDFLSEQPAAYGGIFCSHVIEHLSFDNANCLISLCASALVPEGRLVIVTPNPRDLGVIGETFWLDPTYVRPYPVALLASMLEAAGFEVIERGTFHGGLPKREWCRAFFYRLFLGPFHGHPNAYVVGQKR